ncbi:MAG: ABC transporter permease [Firmicutes bacterium]|jgi:peptide/nickel transport system permease protein|nr:ABC transporter permease [Bacillota bacterium]
MKIVLQKILDGLRFALRDPKIRVGMLLLILLFAFGIIGPHLWDVRLARIGMGPLSQPPSAAHPLGTDATGRDVLALLIVGVPNTLKIGLIAGGIGLSIGMVLGLLAGYTGGIVDTIIHMAADILLTIPLLAVLIVIASYVRVVTVEMMAVIVACLSWAGPTRTVRGQVLSLRDRAFVEIAQLSGLNQFEIIFQELLPNMIAFIAASFVSAVSGGILATIGVEVLGLGPQRIPTLGGTLHWALNHAAVIRGLWWWWVPPVIVLVMIFVGLLLISMGLDEIANPRLRKGA